MAYFSRKLSSTEVKYSTFDRKLLSIYLTIKHFCYFVEGRPFHVLTDHKPLTFALLSVSNRQSPRQLRHLTFISQFTTDIRHVKGTLNTVADALSQIDINCSAVSELPAAVNFVKMADAQQTDPDIDKCKTNSSLQLKAVPYSNVRH